MPVSHPCSFPLIRKENHVCLARCTAPSPCLLLLPPAPHRDAPHPGGAGLRSAAGRLRCQERGCPGRCWRRHAAAGSRRGDGHPEHRRPGQRVARPPGSIAPGPGAGPHCRHPAKAPVHRRQRRESRAATVPDRQRHLPGRRGERRSQRGASRGHRGPGEWPGAALPPAGGAQCHQQAGLRQRRGRRKNRQGQPRCGPGRRDHGPHQPGLCRGHGPDCRPYRPCAGDRRRSGGPG